MGYRCHRDRHNINRCCLIDLLVKLILYYSLCFFLLSPASSFLNYPVTSKKNGREYLLLQFHRQEGIPPKHLLLSSMRNPLILGSDS
jgi:hypothetical protein